MTGKKSSVKRRVHEELGIASRNIMWQWHGDHHDTWYSYSAEVVNYIEGSYNDGKDELDLSEKFPYYNYIIVFSKMQQRNKKTKYRRPIRRIGISSFPALKCSQDDTCETLSSKEGTSKDTASDTTQYTSSSEKMNADDNSVVTQSKNPMMKHVSALWNKLKKAGNSNPSGSCDNFVDSSAKKEHYGSKKVKQSKWNKTSSSSKTSTATSSINNIDWGTGNGFVSSESHKYAIVNGKPWTNLSAPHTPQNKIKPVPGIHPLPHNKRGEKKLSSSNAEFNEADILDEFAEELKVLPSNSSEEQVCIICYENFCDGSSYDDDSTLVKLQLCSHIFHKSCLKAMYESGPKDKHIQCPTCKTIHGIKCGTQPPGEMVYHVLPYSLPGYPECDTIRIIYDIPCGIQGPEHPHPGCRYSSRGFPRHCYLPDNEMGRKVLRLLVTAWERRLVFTIGSSSTTGEENTVTWNDIHHKTEFGWNKYGHGYPDPNYFDNIIAELAAQGVFEKTYTWHPA